MTTHSSADEIFRKSLDRFKIGLSSREQEEFALTSLDDVHDTIRKIEREHATERKMQNMARLQGFLEGMEQYGSLIEVFLNVSAFVAFVWGPMKFLLQIAKNHIESLDALLDAYEKIGETIPLLAQYDKLFASKPAMQRVLGRVYEDILEFHRRALVIFQRKSWQSIFKSAWKDFDRHFKRLLENLKQHRIDVESQASLVEVEKNHAIRKAQEEHFAEMERAEKKRQAISIIEKISPANYNQDQESLANCWSKDESFGGWLFREDKVKAWLNPMNLETNILWLKGIPGAGKSVVASRIIASTKALKQGSVLFFYCKNEDRAKSSLVAILKGLLAQAIYINDDILPYIYDECSKSSEVTLESVEFLKKLIAHNLDRNSPTWIVLDGLDECERKEKKKILQWVASLSKSEQQPGHIRVLIASQDEGEIQKQLAKCPFILLNEAPQHKHAIHTYCIKKAIKIREKFGLSETKTIEPAELTIINLVTERAQGMFLFARLVLKHLKSQVTLTQLRKEIDPAIFPAGLYEIYDRIIQRVYSHPLPQRQAAERILSWITCTKRKIFWHEIQAVFSIDIQSESIDFEGRRLRGMGIKDLCGSLVDISPDKSIRLVHDTARSYLLDSSRPNMQPRVSIAETNLEIAITCLHYLGFPAFDPELADGDISTYLFQGYYSFQEFATAYWSDYLCACTRVENISSTQMDQLVSAIDKLTKRHFVQEREAAQLPDSSFSSEVNTSRLNHHLRTLSASKSFPKSITKYTIPTLQSQLQRRRSIFEKFIDGLPSNDPRKSDMTIYYGDAEGWFKCPREHCYAFYEGFQSTKARDKHLEKHVRQYICSFSGCIYSTLGFTNTNDLNKHRSSAHSSHLEEAALEFPQSGTSSVLPKTKKAKPSTNDPLPGEFGVFIDEMTQFPNGERSDLIEFRKEIDTVDETPPLNSPAPNSKTRFLRSRSISEDDHGKEPMHPSQRVVAQDESTSQQSKSTESLIEELRSFKFDEPGTKPPSGYTSRIGADWIALSTNMDADRKKTLDVDLLFTFHEKSVIPSLAFSLDGKYVAIGGNLFVKVLNTIDGRVLQYLELETKAPADVYCRAVSFDPSGKILASAWEDGPIILSEVSSGLQIGQLVGHVIGTDIYQIDMGRDGVTLVSGGNDRTVRVWDIRTQQNKVTMRAPGGIVSVAVSTDTNLVASGCLNKMAQIWDLKTGMLLKVLSGHEDSIYDVKFLSDCKAIITAGLDKTIMKWEIFPLEGTSTPLIKFQGHNDFALSAALSPGGKWVFSASKDTSVVCWNAETGAAHHIVVGHRNSVIRIATSPVVNMFATVSGDQTMRLWKYNLVDDGRPKKMSNIHDLLS